MIATSMAFVWILFSLLLCVAAAAARFRFFAIVMISSSSSYLVNCRLDLIALVRLRRWLVTVLELLKTKIVMMMVGSCVLLCNMKYLQGN